MAINSNILNRFAHSNIKDKRYMLSKALKLLPRIEQQNRVSTT